MKQDKSGKRKLPESHSGQSVQVGSDGSGFVGSNGLSDAGSASQFNPKPGAFFGTTNGVGGVSSFDLPPFDATSSLGAGFYSPVTPLSATSADAPSPVNSSAAAQDED